MQPLGASPITLGHPLEDANFNLRLPSPHAACCLQSERLQSDARMEVELRDHIYQQIKSVVGETLMYMSHCTALRPSVQCTDVWNKVC